jgi:hypothetical protein
MIIERVDSNSGFSFAFPIRRCRSFSYWGFQSSFASSQIGGKCGPKRKGMIDTLLLRSTKQIIVHNQ